MLATLILSLSLLNPNRVIYSCSYTNCVANISNVAVHFTTAKPITPAQMMQTGGRVTPSMFIKPEIVAVTGVPLSLSYVKQQEKQALIQMQKQGTIHTANSNAVQFPPLDISGFQTSSNTGQSYNLNRNQALSQSLNKQQAIQINFTTQFVLWLLKKEHLKPTPYNAIRIAYTITQDINEGKDRAVAKTVKSFLIATAVVKKKPTQPPKPKPKPKKQPEHHGFFKRLIDKLF